MLGGAGPPWYRTGLKIKAHFHPRWSLVPNLLPHSLVGHSPGSWMGTAQGGPTGGQRDGTETRGAARWEGEGQRGKGCPGTVSPAITVPGTPREAGKGLLVKTNAPGPGNRPSVKITIEISLLSDYKDTKR